MQKRMDYESYYIKNSIDCNIIKRRKNEDKHYRRSNALSNKKEDDR